MQKVEFIKKINAQIKGDEKSLAVLEQKGRFVRFYIVFIVLAKPIKSHKFRKD